MSSTWIAYIKSLSKTVSFCLIPTNQAMQQTATNSEAFLRKRKFYLFLPALVLPFLTLLYGTIGIDLLYRNRPDQAKIQGLNTSLPDAKLEPGQTNGKLGYYKRATEDSAKRRELLKQDPYRSSELLAYGKAEKDTSLHGLDAPYKRAIRMQPVNYQGQHYSDPRQVLVVSKLKALDSVLTRAGSPGFKEPGKSSAATLPAQLKTPAAPELPPLQSRLSSLQDQQPDEPADPELLELNQMLEKVLDIQHPERVADKLQKKTENTPAYAVRSTPQNPSDDRTPPGADALWQDTSEANLENNSFYSLSEEVYSSDQNALTAVVAEDQTVVAGATVKLRLTADGYLAGRLIPKNSFVYGKASVSGERLQIQIASIRLDNALFPVNLSVYDLDGLEGLYIPGAISRDVAKQSLSQDLQTLSIGSYDPSLGAQAASAGLQTAKTLFGRKAQLIQVHLKDGYQVLLKDAGTL
jgi:hypothetical protein